MSTQFSLYFDEELEARFQNNTVIIFQNNNKIHKFLFWPKTAKRLFPELQQRKENEKLSFRYLVNKCRVKSYNREKIANWD